MTHRYTCTKKKKDSSIPTTFKPKSESASLNKFKRADSSRLTHYNESQFFSKEKQNEIKKISITDIVPFFKNNGLKNIAHEFLK